MKFRCLLPIAYCLFLSLPLRADVFWRLPKGADAALQQLGGVRVYSTAVQLNGAPGTLSAYSLGCSAADARASLTRALGAQPNGSLGGALITHAEKNRLRRLFVLPAASGESACVALVFDQSLSDYTRALRAPAAWPEGLPAVAGDLCFSAVCAETRTAFAVAESASDPEAAAQAAAQDLGRRGWAQVSPSASGTFKIFASGKKVCLLFASRAASSNKTLISVLQREGATP